MFYIAIDYENKKNRKGAAGNKNIKIHQMFSKQWILHVWVNLRGLDMNYSFE